MNKAEILKTVTEKYLSSEEFNGQPISLFQKDKRALISLIREGKIEINFGDNHPNPHIKALKLDSKNTQIEKLSTLGLEQGCVYPTKKFLKTVVDSSKYNGKPFSLILALGEPQLNFAAFDLSILEYYRNDPRYYYETDDVRGSISISDKYYRSMRFKPSDKVALQTFGFCYTKKFNRAVAVYYWYLSKLSPEHQQFWYSKILHRKFWLHPDYARNTAGYFGEKESIFTAFIEELHTINEYSKLMEKPPLFKNTYENNKPKEFSFLVRPTSKEFNSFVHLLDIMLSDNINQDFFQNDIAYTIERVRRDGRIIIENKGTITLLEDWLNSKIKFSDPKPKEEMLRVFRLIRKMRNRPAHNLDDNIFNQKYFKEQRRLIISAYGAIRTLRLILANHPSAKNYKVPDWLFKGEIWNY